MMAETPSDDLRRALVAAMIAETRDSLLDMQSKCRILAAFEAGKITQEKAMQLIRECGLEDVTV